MNNTDINGNELRRREEHEVAKSYLAEQKKAKKAWNFPFQDAFLRLGIIK